MFVQLVIFQRVTINTVNPITGHISGHVTTLFLGTLWTGAQDYFPAQGTPKGSLLIAQSYRAMRPSITKPWVGQWIVIFQMANSTENQQKNGKKKKQWIGIWISE